MSVQLKMLAILDPETGSQFLSRDGKTRQVYKEKPIIVKVDGGQSVVEAYDYSVSLSGMIKADELDALCVSQANVVVSGYTESGLVLKGCGRIKKDGTSYIVYARGLGADSSPVTGMYVGKDLSTPVQGLDGIYFPFQIAVSASYYVKSGGVMKIVAKDISGEVVEEFCKEHPPLGRHAFKALGSMQFQLPKDACYVSVVGEQVNADNLSLTIAL